LLVQAKSLARESVFQRLSGQWPKWREFILNQTMKRPCFFAEHGSGGGKTAAILAEFSSQNLLLAPLWFALKSRLLRHFFGSRAEARIRPVGIDAWDGPHGARLPVPGAGPPAPFDFRRPTRLRALPPRRGVAFGRGLR
jgi:hypothetical protein